MVRISSYIRKPSSYMTLHPIPSEFPYIWGKFCFLFISASPWTLRFFPRIWRHFCVPQTTLNLPCSPYTLKYFLCILRIRRKNEEYVERNFTFNNAWGLVRMYVKKKFKKACPYATKPLLFFLLFYLTPLFA